LKETTVFEIDHIKPSKPMFLSFANKYFKEFLELTREKIEKGTFDQIGFGMQTEQYFLLNVTLTKRNLPTRAVREYTSILYLTMQNGNVHGELIGKNLRSENPGHLANETLQYFNGMVEGFRNEYLLQKESDK